MSQLNRSPFDVAESLEKIMKFILVIFVCVAGFFYTCDPLKNFITLNFFPKNTTDLNVSLTMFAILIGLLFSIVFMIGKKSEILSKQIGNVLPNLESKQYINGFANVYNIIDEYLDDKRILKTSKKIDIIDLNLYYLGLKLDEWKRHKKLEKAEINIYYLDPGFINSCLDIDPNFKTQLIVSIDQIKNTIQNNSDWLSKKDVEINLYPYKHIPAVLGFKLGNGAVYVGQTQWNEHQKMEPSNLDTQYKQILTNDSSKDAKISRQHFDSWLNKAKIQT